METALYSARATFYALTPEEVACESLQDVPNIASVAFPCFVVLFVLDALYLLAKGGADQWRLHETIVNICSMGLANMSATVLFRTAELSLFDYVFEKWRVATFPNDSYSTFVFALLKVELAAYWWHRAAHEVALLWAAHHVHHSSEDMNLSVAPRVSILRPFYKWAFYVPLVLTGLPPCVMVVHMQLGIIYTAWTHNDTIPKISKLIPGLGHAIEYVLVTPSHHRVHHGANKYCLDKNYGMVLIIYDRMFGTFAEEREDEAIVYGTLGQKDSYHIVGIQLIPMVELWEKTRSMDTFGNKLRSLFYGPGWIPGTPRLGNMDDIPDVRNRTKHQFRVPAWFSLYLAVNAITATLLYFQIIAQYNTMDSWLPVVILGFLVLSYTSLGDLYDSQAYGIALEPLRLLLYLVLARVYPLFISPLLNQISVMVSAFSLLFCLPIARVTLTRAEKRAKVLEAQPLKGKAE